VKFYRSQSDAGERLSLLATTHSLDAVSLLSSGCSHDDVKSSPATLTWSLQAAPATPAGYVVIQYPATAIAAATASNSDE